MRWAGGIGIAILVLLLAAGPGRAETHLRSDQNDVHLSIRGGVSLNGEAPLPLSDLPPGHYRYRADGLGLALGRGRLDCTSGSTFVGRSWADIRSMFLPPGTTHLAAGEPLRGFLLLSGAGLSGVQFLRMNSAHANAVDDVSAAVTAYERAVSEDAIAKSAATLALARAKEKDEKDLRALWGGYFAATWIGAAVEGLLLTPSPSLESGADGNYLITVPEAGGWEAGIRSILVPGAGQRYLGHEGKANFFAASVLSLGAGTLLAHESFLKARRRQAAAQEDYDAARSEAEVRSASRALDAASSKTDDKNRLRWVLFGATAGVYLWNIMDAAVEGSRASEMAPVQLSVVPGAGGLQASVSWRLP